MSIGSPFREVYSVVVDVLECAGGKFSSFGHDVGSEEVFDTVGGFSFSEDKELVYEDIAELGLTLLILFVEFGELGVGAL